MVPPCSTSARSFTSSPSACGSAWPIERQVSELRHQRNEASDDLMKQLTWHKAAPSDPAAQKAEEDARTHSAAVRKDFGTWHLWSLLLNMLTIALVTVAMGMTAF